MLRMVFFFLVLAASAAYALRKGGGPERAVALLLVAAVLATLLAQAARPVRFHDVEMGVLLVDAALFLGLLAVALRAERYWPLWMTALQGVAVAGHGAKAVNPHVIPWAYAVLLAFWGYPMVALLAAATWRHQQRLRKFGKDGSWTRSWLPSRTPTPAAAPTD
ncbi:MAG: hypothetical protein JWO25_3526 [Alphaproteobacteria bacterium]|nr:hypothetical protein [Alphaproteobacteria bacterium]